MHRLASDVRRGWRLQEPPTSPSAPGWERDPHAREVVRYVPTVEELRPAGPRAEVLGPGRQATSIKEDKESAGASNKRRTKCADEEAADAADDSAHFARSGRARLQAPGACNRPSTAGWRCDPDAREVVRYVSTVRSSGGRPARPTTSPPVGTVYRVCGQSVQNAKERTTVVSEEMSRHGTSTSHHCCKRRGRQRRLQEPPLAPRVADATRPAREGGSPVRVNRWSTRPQQRPHYGFPLWGPCKTSGLASRVHACLEARVERNECRGDGCRRGTVTRTVGDQGCTRKAQF